MKLKMDERYRLMRFVEDNWDGRLKGKTDQEIAEAASATCRIVCGLRNIQGVRKALGLDKTPPKNSAGVPDDWHLIHEVVIAMARWLTTSDKPAMDAEIAKTEGLLSQIDQRAAAISPADFSRKFEALKREITPYRDGSALVPTIISPGFGV